MSWKIELLRNTVQISSKIAILIRRAAKQNGCEDLVAVDEGKLIFSYDHCEHMDYIAGEAGEWLIPLLKKAKVTGQALFRDTESCSPAEYWGHEFDGKGGYVRLIGAEEITWTPDSTHA